jgi:hypothetical protein
MDMKLLSTKSILQVAILCFAIMLYRSVGAQVYFAKSDLFNVLESSCSNYLNVEANDSFTGPAFLQVVTHPMHGSAGVNVNYLTYCPNIGYIGSDEFTYSITANGHTDTANVHLNVEPFNSEVYPGDADQNGKVENFDVLVLGLGYNSTGPSRLAATALNALAWPPSPHFNTNPGAADCNGDGIVDTADMDEINLFYDDSVAFGEHYDIDTSICGNGIPFYIEALGSDTVLNGDTLKIIINLGQSATVNTAYGVAFTLNYDTTFIPPNSIQFSTSGAWLLQNDPGLFFLHEANSRTGVDIALTKTNQKDAQGGGPVILAIMPIDDNICGIEHAVGWYNLDLSISRPRLINAYNEVQYVCMEQPTISVYKSVTAIKNVVAPTVSVYPNPASDEIFIRAESIERVDITDLSGRKVYSATYNGIGLVTLSTKDAALEAGAYMVNIKTSQGTGVKKIVIEQ